MAFKLMIWSSAWELLLLPCLKSFVRLEWFKLGSIKWKWNDYLESNFSELRRYVQSPRKNDYFLILLLIVWKVKTKLFLKTCVLFHRVLCSPSENLNLWKYYHIVYFSSDNIQTFLRHILMPQNENHIF